MLLKPGQTIDNFQVLDALGEGAFGTVYKVHDTDQDRVLAMKILKARPEATMLDSVKEARPLAALRHPHIVTFQGLHPLRDGSMALLMDYVPGETLEQFHDREHDPRVLFMLLNQVAFALDYAHSMGVVHRDVKPANILVTQVQGKPSALLSDFGLGREEGFDLQSTYAIPAGTLPFMAPEAFRPTEEVPSSVDRWALAVTAYYLLTEGFPFSRQSDGFPDFTRPVPLATFLPHAPDGLQLVLGKALDPFPHRRFDTCREFTSLLGAAIGVTLPNTPGPPPDPIPPPKQRYDLPPVPPNLQIDDDPNFDLAVMVVLNGMRSDLPSRRERYRSIGRVNLHWRVLQGQLVVGLPSRNAMGRVGDRSALTALGFAPPGAGDREWTVRLPVKGDIAALAERAVLGLVHGYRMSPTVVANDL